MAIKSPLKVRRRLALEAMGGKLSGHRRQWQCRLDFAGIVDRAETASSNLSRTAKKNSEPTLLMLICFVAIYSSSFVAAREFANWAAIRIAYGSERAAKEHLYVVKDKHDIIVSNGEVLKSRVAVADRMVMLVLWFGLVFPLWIAVFYLFPSQPPRLFNLSGIPLRLAVGVGVLMIAGEFLLIVSRPLVASVVIAAIVVAGSLACAWIVRAFHRIADRSG